MAFQCSDTLGPRIRSRRIHWAHISGPGGHTGPTYQVQADTLDPHIRSRRMHWAHISGPGGHTGPTYPFLTLLRLLQALKEFTPILIFLCSSQLACCIVKIMLALLLFCCEANPLRPYILYMWDLPIEALHSCEAYLLRPYTQLWGLPIEALHRAGRCAGPIWTRLQCWFVLSQLNYSHTLPTQPNTTSTIKHTSITHLFHNKLASYTPP